MSDNLYAMILFPGVVCTIGFLSGFLTMSQIKTWYQKQIKPRLTPPNWVFGPVWSVLFFLIGVSGYLMWTTDKDFTKHRTAWFWYFAQLVFNYLWTPMFFTFHKKLAASIDITLLDVSIIMTIKNFYQVYPLAGILMIPYLCWVSFANYLCWGIWYLNRKNENEKEN